MYLLLMYVTRAILQQFLRISLCLLRSAPTKKKKETAENIQALFEWILAKHAQIIENVNQNDKNEEF